MNGKVYDYMDWPRIEAIVYGEEPSPRDVLSPRLTTDGILIQGFFPGAETAEVLTGRRVFPMEAGRRSRLFRRTDPGQEDPFLSVPCNKRR